MVTIAKILRRPKYLVVVILITLTMIAFAAWLPNLHLITKTMTSSTMSLWQKTNLLIALFGSLQTNFTPLSRTLTVTSATLTGIQTSLLIYYLRRTARIQTEMGVSLAGVATSMLGVGCASCGSVLLTSLIGLGSATTVLGILPFRGPGVWLYWHWNLTCCDYLYHEENKPTIYLCRQALKMEKLNKKTILVFIAVSALVLTFLMQKAVRKSNIAPA